MLWLFPPSGNLIPCTVSANVIILMTLGRNRSFYIHQQDA